MDQTWRKSSRSDANGTCVEVRLVDGRVEVRDSKNPKGPILTFDPAVWVGFVGDITR